MKPFAPLKPRGLKKVNVFIALKYLQTLLSRAILKIVNFMQN